jgi:hypothetical protein
MPIIIVSAAPKEKEFPQSIWQQTKIQTTETSAMADE